MIRQGLSMRWQLLIGFLMCILILGITETYFIRLVTQMKQKIEQSSKPLSHSFHSQYQQDRVVIEIKTLCISMLNNPDMVTIQNALKDISMIKEKCQGNFFKPILNYIQTIEKILLKVAVANTKSETDQLLKTIDEKRTALTQSINDQKKSIEEKRKSAFSLISNISKEINVYKDNTLSGILSALDTIVYDIRAIQMEFIQSMQQQINLSKELSNQKDAFDLLIKKLLTYHDRMDDKLSPIPEMMRNTAKKIVSRFYMQFFCDTIDPLLKGSLIANDEKFIEFIKLNIINKYESETLSNSTDDKELNHSIEPIISKKIEKLIDELMMVFSCILDIKKKLAVDKKQSYSLDNELQEVQSSIQTLMIQNKEKIYQSVSSILAELTKLNKNQLSQSIEMSHTVDSLLDNTVDEVDKYKFMLINTSILGVIIMSILALYFYRVFPSVLNQIIQYADISSIDQPPLDIKDKGEIGRIATIIHHYKQSQIRLIQMIQLLPCAVIELDDNFTICFINNAGANLVNLPPENCIGKKCFDLFQTNHCKTDECDCLIALNQNKSVHSNLTIQCSEETKHVSITTLSIPTENSKKSLIKIITENTTLLTGINQLQTHYDTLTQLAESFDQSYIDFHDMSDNFDKTIYSTNDQILSIAKRAKEIVTFVDQQENAIRNLTSGMTSIVKNINYANQLSRDASEKTADVNDKIQELVTASEQIGKVISAINDIADRTDLLALNAAIEAEGAGVAGKGFAVVADEVQKLAKQSSDATDEIAQEIDRIQKSTTNVVQVIVKINSLINEILKISENNAVVMEEKKGVAEKFNSYVQQMMSGNKAIEQQSEDLQYQIQTISNTIQAFHKKSDQAQELSTTLNEFASNFKACIETITPIN